MEPPKPPLQVNHRRIVQGNGGDRVTPLVRCPQHGGVVDLDRCGECGNALGLSVSPESAGLALHCDKVPDPASVPEALAASAQTLSSPVEQIMQRNVVCLAADTPLALATAALLDGGFSGAPVVDVDGRPVGVISLTDLARQQRRADTDGASAGSHSSLVSDWMTPVVCSVPENAEIARAAAVMAFEGIHRVPVVSSERQVVGIVSALDILRAVARSHGFALPLSPPSKQPRADERRL